MDARGALTGGLVGAVFGLVFVLVNSGGLGTWTTVLRVAGVVVALLVVADLVRRLGPAAGGSDRASTPASSPWGRGYRLVVLAEAVALFGGVQVVVRLLDAPRYAIAWVCFVVGVHFVALGALWRVTRFQVLAAVLVALSFAAVLVGASGGSDAAVRLVAGVGAGVVLLAFAASSGRGAVARAAAR